MVDPQGLLIRDLRANEALDDEVDGKVWGEELPTTFNGAPLPKDPRPFVLVIKLGNDRRPRQPVQVARYAMRCVHKTRRQAAELYGLVSDELHNTGSRIGSNGVAIYRINEEVGGQPGLDPITDWPNQEAIYEVFATDRAVA